LINKCAVDELQCLTSLHNLSEDRVIFSELAQGIAMFPQIIKGYKRQRNVRKIISESWPRELRDHLFFPAIGCDKVKVAGTFRNGSCEIFHAQNAGINGSAFLNLECTYDFVGP
jgi:hypothetical protein